MTFGIVINIDMRCDVSDYGDFGLCFDFFFEICVHFRFSFGWEGQPNREGFDYFVQLGDEQEFWTQPI